MVCLDHRDLREPLESKDHLDHKEFQELLDRMASPVSHSDCSYSISWQLFQIAKIEVTNLFHQYLVRRP